MIDIGFNLLLRAMTRRKSLPELDWLIMNTIGVEEPYAALRAENILDFMSRKKMIWELASAIGSPVHKILDDQKTSMNLVYQLMASDKKRLSMDGVVRIDGMGSCTIDLGVDFRPYESYRMAILCHMKDFTFESCKINSMKVCIWVGDRTIDLKVYVCGVPYSGALPAAI